MSEIVNRIIWMAKSKSRDTYWSNEIRKLGPVITYFQKSLKKSLLPTASACLFYAGLETERLSRSFSNYMLGISQELAELMCFIGFSENGQGFS